jgi:hypothetical protein
LNEEIFAISEVLASAFSTNQPNASELSKKAQEFYQRKSYLEQRIRQHITTHPTVKQVRNSISTI